MIELCEAHVDAQRRYDGMTLALEALDAETRTVASAFSWTLGRAGWARNKGGSTPTVVTIGQQRWGRLVGKLWWRSQEPAHAE